jgi:sensor histidine kinase YesM
VEGYLEFERLRLGDRLRATIDVDGALRGVLVPPLVLQPLVENAVNHGVAPRRSGGTIAISACTLDGKLRLCVEDDGPGPNGSTHRGTGTSQSDLESRLRLNYGEGASLIRGPGARGGFRAELILPLEPLPGSMP